MIEIEIRVRVRCVGHTLGVPCTESAETWATARLDGDDSLRDVRVQLPNGWRELHVEPGHYCPMHVALYQTDRATADRVLRWAAGRMGVTIAQDADGFELRWRVRGDEVRTARGATLAAALDAAERPAIEPPP